MLLSAGCHTAAVVPSRDNTDFVPIHSAAGERELDLALQNLADDEVKWNCHQAMYYLYERRAQIKDTLVSRLDGLDWQGQEAVMRILCETASFEPDARFVNLVFSRLHSGSELDLGPHHSTHYDFIIYLTSHARPFSREIGMQVRSKDLVVQWAATYILAKAQLLGGCESYDSQAMMSDILANLKDDRVCFNAAYTVRICLLLGSRCLPALRDIMKGGDNQSYQLARLLIDAIAKRSKNAVEQINAVCPVESGFMSRGLMPLPEIIGHPEPRFLKATDKASQPDAPR